VYESRRAQVDKECEEQQGEEALTAGLAAQRNAQCMAAYAGSGAEKKNDKELRSYFAESATY
jgi:hypothetical protein